MKRKHIMYLLSALVLMIVGTYIYTMQSTIEVSYNQFNEMLQQGEIEQVQITDGAKIQFKKNGEDIKYKTDNPRKESLKEELLLKDVEVIEAEMTLGLIQYVVSLIIVGGAIYFVIKVAKKRENQQAMAISAQAINVEEIKVGFKQIAGNIEAKEQVADIITFIKEPDKYMQIGAKMPKGIMFYGPPGTGKTLMAKAIAKEAGVPFFSVSGSDFMQMYVGVGASRIREIFKEAKKHQKAVIFIDEIDTIGKKRGNSVGGGADEKDQTLNALLTEMSGFKEEEGVIVIAATNRLDVLDEALLRPGRFDRHIEIGYPDKNARKQIIDLYLKNKKVDESIDLESLATQTVYFTGAMIENLLNEAAIFACKRNESVISKEHVDQAFYTIIAGAQKKDKSNISQKDKELTAFHEAGHALVTKLVEPTNIVAKVTIIPSTKGAGGFSMNIPKERMYMSKKDIINQIKISLAGRAAEELIFGKDFVTTGASNDIEKATKYIKDYMLKYGMDEEVGLINMEVLQGSGEIRDPKSIQKCSEKLEQIYEETKELLKGNKDLLIKISQELIQNETLNEEDINLLICT